MGLKRSDRWLQAALLNFVVVALAGVALRYKVTFPLPAVDFKNLLHAHSHFAFAGWVSTALFALMIAFFASPEAKQDKAFRVLFWFSQVTSYGMLISFLVQEYGTISIGFSTAYICVTYAMAIVLWRITSKEKAKLSVKALRASLIFLAISSLGPYALAYIKAAHVLNGELYHNSIYWYLHFQYNGWFSFAVFALFLRVREDRPGYLLKTWLTPYRLLLIACVPVYLLSILWIIPPLWVFIIAGAGGTLQLIALVMIVKQLVAERKVSKGMDATARSLFLFAGIAFTIKLLLQFLSVFPTLNQFVFGHRPVIIGYLHLVMLGFVSFFVFAFAISQGLVNVKSSPAKSGIWIFVTGVLANEVGLMLQGFSGILYTTMKWIPVFLFCASVTMFVGLALLGISQLRARNREEELSGAMIENPGT